MSNQPFIIPSLLLTLLAIPLVVGLIPRNRFYGIRTAQTLADAPTWYRTNRFGGSAILISGAIYLLVASVFPTPKPAGANFALWGLHLCAFALPLLASVLITKNHLDAS